MRCKFNKPNIKYAFRKEKQYIMCVLPTYNTLKCVVSQCSDFPNLTLITIDRKEYTRHIAKQTLQ